MAQRIPKKKSYNEEIDEFSDEGESDNVGQKFITVHKSVTHIGVINGPVVIGPQFNNTHNPMQPSTWYNHQAHPPDEYKNDIEEHFNRCINEKRYIETNEIKAIADKITNNQLPKLCHNLGIAEERLQTWMSMDGEHKPAFIMLYYWTQINDMAATVDKLAKVLKECEEFDALKALTPTSLQNR